MPDSLASAREKPKVWKVIEHELGPMRMPTARRRDWRVTRDGKTFVFVTYSKYYEAADCWWYGLAPGDLAVWRKYENAFVIFVAEHEQEAIVIPVDQLDAQLKKIHLPIDKKTGHFKLHLILAIGRYRFRELPRFDISGYYRNFALLNR
jgi:hypothetical protein